MFSRFEQADSSISRRFGGTGLGLFISMKLANLMNGTIKVSSVEGKGSTFQLILPYQATDFPEKQQLKEHAAEPLHEQLVGSVLVAEDTPELKILEQRILEKMGLTVTVVSNGQEALEMALSKSFDVILMDMQMPVMDGIEATRLIRDAGVKTPIIALTANVMPQHQSRFYEAGCDHFIGKPIDKQHARSLSDLASGVAR